MTSQHFHNFGHNFKYFAYYVICISYHIKQGVCLFVHFFSLCYVITFQKLQEELFQELNSTFHVSPNPNVSSHLFSLLLCVCPSIQPQSRYYSHRIAEIK